MMSVILPLMVTGAPIAQPYNFSGTSQSDTTLQIAVQYTTVYPGSQTWVAVLMKNPDVEVLGYDLYLGIVDADLARFCQDDTGGCLVSNGEMSQGCECLDEDCAYVHTWWSGSDSIYIDKSSSWGILFRICVAACCIPDSTADRNTYIQLDGQVFDLEGTPVAFSYQEGELLTWWSLPGDASGDSLVTGADVVFLINYLFRNGVLPCVCEAADCNGDCTINSGDIVYLIGYLFRSGPAPVPGCAHCPHENCWPQ